MPTSEISPPPSKQSRYLDQAFAAFSEGKWAEARPGLTQAVAGQPRNAQLHGALGITCFQLGDFRAAAKAFFAAVNLSPGDADLWSQLAMTHIELGEVAAAEQAARRAVELRPDDVPALKLLAACLEALGNTATAAVYNRRASILQGVPVKEKRRETPARPVDHPKNGRAQSDLKLDAGLTLDLGACSYIHDSHVRNPSGARTHLVIGKFCSIASNLSIVGYDHKTEWISTFPFLDNEHRKRWPGTKDIPYLGDPECGGNFDRGNITIGNDVWIGFNVTLFKGVTIGDGAVIGAGSLVNKDVPPFTIVAGIPARPIRKRFTDEEVATLRRIAWWDWPSEKINRYMPYLCSARIAELEAELAAEAGKASIVPFLNGATPPAVAVDFQPIHELIKRRPASVKGCISEEDAEFIHATIAELRPDAVLEIGVASGLSSAVILKSLEMYAPEAALVSYDISPQCYYDSSLPVGYCVAEMIPEHRVGFQLITGNNQLFQAKKAVSAFRRKLIFIDANHNPPYPALDFLHTLDLAAPGDVFLFHDINLPTFLPEFAYSCGAEELYRILPDSKWSCLGQNNNIGAYRFDGDYRGLWQILSGYLASFKYTKENLNALHWLSKKAGLKPDSWVDGSRPAAVPGGAILSKA